LKDLVTLRNPASPYTFLQYTKAKGRLERFVNLKEFHPTRVEFQDYLRWVAEAFSDQVKYGTAVRKVTPMALDGEARPSVFRVEVQSVDTREVSVYYARNVVYASGGKPRVPEGKVSLAPRIFHSSEFLHRFPGSFTEHAEPCEFGVVGDGQSAGEIAAELLHTYPRARVHLFVSGYAPRPVDNSPFVNEAFFSTEAEAFYVACDQKRKAMRSELRNTNYGVIDIEVINDLYRSAYQDEVKGEQRLFVHRFSKLVSAEQNGDGVKVTTQEHCGGKAQVLRCDGLVLATGYKRCLDESIFTDLLPFVEKNDSGEAVLSRNYHVRTTTRMDCRLYVQGYGESSHGIGDTLLSLLPFRSKEIFDDICEHAPRAVEHAGNGHSASKQVALAVEHAGNGHSASKQIALAVEHAGNGIHSCQHAALVMEHTGNGHSASVKLNGHAEYPPKRHLENDPEKLYAVIERFKFATVISVQASGEPVVTHVPLTLDRSRGAKGVLFGHMDKANPHIDAVEGRRLLAVFHGPNSYISPHVYETDQLPTWNSITVHAWGKARLLRDQRALIRGLMGICEQSDHRPNAYRLDAEDHRIDQLIDYILGFEIEIDELIGRFKLSQDRAEEDRRLAAIELARNTEAGERALIERVLGYRL
jgi:L-ornithine N5-oxygenase